MTSKCYKCNKKIGKDMFVWHNKKYCSHNCMLSDFMLEGTVKHSSNKEKINKQSSKNIII